MLEDFERLHVAWADFVQAVRAEAWGLGISMGLVWLVMASILAWTTFM